MSDATDEREQEPVGRTDAEKQSMCDRCGGCCCSFRSMDISFGQLAEDETVRERLHRLSDFDDGNGEVPSGTQLLRQSGDAPDMDWYLTDERRILFECNHLTNDGRCGIYDDRPDMCQRWECAALQGYTDVSGMLQENYQDPQRIADADLEDITDDVADVLERLRPAGEVAAGRERSDES